MHRLRDVLICSALLAVPLLFLRANLRERSSAGSLDRAILALSAPVQKVASEAAGAVLSLWRDYVFLVRLRADNERLRRENVELKAEVDHARQGADRLRRYERLLDLRGETPAETLAARVIARETSPYSRAVRIAIDRGEREIGLGMPVLTAEGVVGRVEKAYAGYTDVLLAVDPRSAIDVRILPSGARGIAKGLGADAFGCRLDYVLREESVHAGDRVVTSGEGGAFPKDVAVGSITRVSRPSAGLYQEVEIQPAVDFARLEEVLVLLAPPPTEDPEARARAREPARGLAAHR